MTLHPFEITHIVIPSQRPFETVIGTLEALLGGEPSPEQWTLLHDLAETHASWEQVTDAIQPFIGPSGFMCMVKIDLGSLLSLQGRHKRSIRYILGNPVIANQMIEHHSEVGLYAPLSVLVYQDDGGQTTIAYDQPSSLMRSFRNSSITTIAQMLDTKLAELTTQATGNTA